jgi:ubiquinone/menaquinone biosynthesis C-methylase UbiE
MLVDLGLDSTATLVDFGAGTGTFALAAARRCAEVVAVDVSRAMLAVAVEEADRLRVANVRFAEAGFLTYDHAGPPVDFVYSRNALHHLPDFWKAVALDRVARMLKPGGYLRLRDLVFSFKAGDAAEAIEAWLVNAPMHAHEGWTRSEREKDVREEHVTFSWLLEPLLERAGFDLTDVDYDETRIYGAYTCRRRA